MVNDDPCARGTGGTTGGGCDDAAALARRSRPVAGPAGLNVGNAGNEDGTPAPVRGSVGVGVLYCLWPAGRGTCPAWVRSAGVSRAPALHGGVHAAGRGLRTVAMPPVTCHLSPVTCHLSPELDGS